MADNIDERLEQIAEEMDECAARQAHISQLFSLISKQLDLLIEVFGEGSSGPQGPGLAELLRERLDQGAQTLSLAWRAEATLQRLRRDLAQDTADAIVAQPSGQREEDA